MDFSKKLIQWYLENKRDLPWRKSSSPYKVWLSEIILQQTRVNQGMDYYFKFINQYPTVFALADASEEQILKLWQGLGYYSRARNLHETAKIIVEKYNGEFPSSFEELIKLKGIGDYTASAIASICFNKQTAVVDGNVYRVLSRYFGVSTPINSTEGVKYFKKLAQDLLSKNNPGTYNQALMEFGALHCKPQNPSCESCIFNQSCAALQKKQVNELPIKIKKVSIKKRHFNYLVVVTKNNTTIVSQRKSGIWKNLFEFPLIETDKEVDFKELIYHDYFEKLFKKTDYNIKLFNQQSIVHKLSHQHIHTKFWVVELEAHLKATTSWNEIDNFPMPILMANFVSAFKSN